MCSTQIRCRGGSYGPALFGALLFVVMCPAPASATELVEVRFDVKAPSFVTNLDTGRAEVESRSTAKLAELLDRFFPLVAWKPQPQPGSTATLALSLADERGRALPAIVLTWSATIEGQAIRMPELPGVRLYEPFDLERETHDPEELSRILAKTLEEWFGNSSNRALFQRSFLRNVPLARSVTADPAAQRIVMPVSLASSRMDAKSSLRVRFEIVGPDGGAENGELNVTSLLENRAGSSPPATLGKVTEFNFSGAPPVAGWSPQIPALLSRPNKSRVFVDLYIYSDANTVDGVFVDP